MAEAEEGLHASDVAVQEAVKVITDPPATVRLVLVSFLGDMLRRDEAERGGSRCGAKLYAQKVAQGRVEVMEGRVV